MPRPIAFDIRDAVASELMLGMVNFAPAFAPVTRALPNWSLKELGELRVTVVAPLVESTPLSRHSTQDTFQIEIGVQQRIVSDDVADFETKVGEIVGLGQQIADYLARRVLAAFPSAGYAGHTFAPYDPQALNEDRLVTSVVTVRYIVAR